MTEALRESLIHMVHTKEGARVAMACVWGGSAKVSSPQEEFGWKGTPRREAQTLFHTRMHVLTHAHISPSCPPDDPIGQGAALN